MTHRLGVTVTHRMALTQELGFGALCGADGGASSLPERVDCPACIAATPNAPTAMYGMPVRVLRKDRRSPVGYDANGSEVE